MEGVETCERSGSEILLKNGTGVRAGNAATDKKNRVNGLDIHEFFRERRAETKKIRQCGTKTFKIKFF